MGEEKKGRTGLLALSESINRLSALNQALSNEQFLPTEQALWGMCWIVDNVIEDLEALHKDMAAGEGGTS